MSARFSVRVVSDLKLPGDELGVEEEYSPGSGVYVDEKGFLRAKILGVPVVDSLRHVLDLKPLKKPVLPLREGDVVFAVVELIRDPVAFTKIFYVETRNSPLTPPLSGVLPISNVSTSRVKSLYDVIGYGDVIRARIAENGGPPYLLSIKGREYGVVVARCPKCLTPMRIQGLRLICPACKSKTRRKTSSKYFLR